MADTTQQTLLEEILAAEEARLKKEEEQKAARKEEVETGGTADVKPVTRQAVYGETIDEISQMESNLRDAKARMAQRGISGEVPIQDVPLGEMTLGEFAYPVTKAQAIGEEEPKVSKEVDIKTLEETPQQIKRVKQEQEQAYQAVLNLDSDELQSEYEKLANQYGWETTVDSVTGTKYFVPPPSFANNPLLVTGARAASETARGILSSITPALEAAGLVDEDVRKEIENFVPKIEDESVLVTAGSEMISLLGGAATGYKVASAFFKNAPKLVRALQLLAGAATGEALVATEETGTLKKALGFDAPEGAVETKLQVAMESLGLGTILNSVLTGAKAVGQLSPVRTAFDALGTLFFGGKNAAEEAVSQSLVDTAVLTKRAKDRKPGSKESITGPITDEERLVAVNELRDRMRESFKVQTGKDMDDVIEGRVQMDKDEFEGTLAGLLASNEFSAIERQILTGSFRQGVIERQQAAIATTEQRLGTQEQAKEAGESAQQEIKASLEAEEETAKVAVTAPLQRQVDEALDELDAARQSDAALTQTGKTANAATRLKANKFTKAATERVRKAFVDMRNAKNKAYDAYLTQAQKIEIPVSEVRTLLASQFKGREIGDIPQLLATQNKELRSTLQQILSQDTTLATRVAQQESAKAGKLFQASLAKYRKANKLGPTDEIPATAQAELKETAEANSKITPAELTKIKKEIGYQDTVKLSNVETLREGIEFTNSRAYRFQDRNLADATDMLKEDMNGLINKYLRTNGEAAAARNSANALNTEFKDTFFPDAGADIADMLRFGYKMTDNEMAAAATRFRTKLNGAVRGDADDIQYINQVRSKMTPDAQARLDAEIEEAMYNEVLNDLAKFDMRSKAAKADPVGTVRKLNDRIEALLAGDAFALLPKSVVTRLNERFTPLFKTADNVVDAQKALDDAAAELRKIEREVAEDPAYALVSNMRKSEPITIVKSILQDENNAVTMAALWERAGTRGPKLDTGLTQAQQDLRTIFARGLIDVAKEPGEAALKGSLTNMIDRNKAFNTYFPPNSPERQSMDLLISQIKAMDVYKGAGAKLPIEESVKDLSTFTEQLITYIKGPLTPEGRRLKIISRFYFKMAGGRDELKNVLIDTVTNPIIADRILKDAQERIARGLVSKEEAYKLSLGQYMLGRFGIASFNDLQREIKQFSIEQDTEEGLPVQ